MTTKLHGLTRRTHVILLCLSLLVLAGFLLLAVLSVMLIALSPVQWCVVVFLMLWASVMVAWEIRVLWLFRLGRTDTDH